ncbi:hypothetical protein [Kitasatospora sp. NPDC094015]|uniref:hypothetical protein n=1 Tax=Kitasatospora sp. NPDC094015 TaxID=3155205 RepID=UPI00331825C1
MPYSELQAVMREIVFHEGGTVPRDSQQVGTTWQYVNVNGGPDRRFKENPQIPVMLYGRINFTTSSGLDLHWDCSRPSSARLLAAAIASYVVPPAVAD